VQSIAHADPPEHSAVHVAAAQSMVGHVDFPEHVIVHERGPHAIGPQVRPEPHSSRHPASLHWHVAPSPQENGTTLESAPGAPL
jgi:hypothetical protein